MDKFAIFKLLGSFLDVYKKSQSPIDKNQSGTTENPLASLFKKPESSPAPTPPPAPPLRDDMLATMRTHDEFVKRVNKNNPKY